MRTRYVSCELQAWSRFYLSHCNVVFYILPCLTVLQQHLTIYTYKLSNWIILFTYHIYYQTVVPNWKNLENLVQVCFTGDHKMLRKSAKLVIEDKSKTNVNHDVSFTTWEQNQVFIFFNACRNIPPFTWVVSGRPNINNPKQIAKINQIFFFSGMYCPNSSSSAMMTPWTMRNWESMARQNSMMKKRMDHTGAAGNWVTASGYTT